MCHRTDEAAGELDAADLVAAAGGPGEIADDSMGDVSDPSEMGPSRTGTPGAAQTTCDPTIRRDRATLRPVTPYRIGGPAKEGRDEVATVDPAPGGGRATAGETMEAVVVAVDVS